MQVYMGSLTPSSVVYHMFNTQDLAGAPITLAGSPAVLVYKNGGTTESTSTGITLTVDFDARTGLQAVAIDTSLNSSFFADGSECFSFLSAGTVDGVSVVGKVVAQFTIAATQTVTVGTNSDKTGYRLSATGVADILTTALVESYAADGAAGTLSQILFAVQAFLQEKNVSGTTLTVKKLDGAATAMTFTLSDASNPVSITRAT